MAAVVVGGQIHTSADSGLTWTATENPRRWSSIASSADGGTLVAVASDDTLAYKYDGRIHISFDGGATWTPRESGRIWKSVACSSDGTKLVATEVGGHLYTSVPTVPELSYIPPRDAVGTVSTQFNFQVEDDGAPGSNLDPVPNTFSLQITNLNDAPEVAVLIPDLTIPRDSPFNYQFPLDTFRDADAENVFAYTATRADGTALPAWLTFSSATRTFSGLPGPAEGGIIEISLRATDSGNPPRSVSNTFRITVNHSAPGGTDGAIVLDEDESVTLGSASFGFTDPSDTPPDKFFQIKITSLPTAGSLSLNGLALAAGDLVPMVPDARKDWTPRGGLREWMYVASSADGMTLAAINSYNPDRVDGSDGLHISVDGGQTWSVKGPFEFWGRVAISADGSRMVAAPIQGPIYTSTDFGQSWIARTGMLTCNALTSSADGMKLAAANFTTLRTSTDGGLTWAVSNLVRVWSCLAASADGTKLVAGTSSDKIYLSSDFGITWIPTAQPRGWVEVASSADGTRLAAIDNTTAFLWASNDSGQTWTERENTRAWSKIFLSADGSRQAGITSSRILMTSIDYGETWSVKDRVRSWSAVAGSADGLMFAAASRGDPGALSVTGRIFTSVAEIPTLAFTPAADASGTPYASFTFQVQDDGPGTTTLDPVANTFTFSVRPLPDPPRLVSPLLDRSAVERTPFSYQIPEGSFSEPDANGTLTYSARLQNGNSLPAWLHFSPETRAFSGTPGTQDTGVLLVQVTAVKNSVPPLSVSDVFQLTVVNVDDPPAGTNGAGVLPPNGVMSFNAANFGFTDPNDQPANRFTRVKVTTLPSSGTLSLSGVPVTAGAFVSFLTTAAGETWTARETSRNWYSVASSDDGSRLAAVVQNGLIYTSSDAGATWTGRASVRNWYSIASSADGMKLAAVMQNGQIYTSANAGETWVARESSRVWRCISSSANGANLAAVVQNGLMYISHDSGVTWSAKGVARNWFSIASSADGTRLAACVFGGTTWVSTDAGESWTAGTAQRDWRSITISDDGTKLAAVVSNGLIYTSLDGGLTWTPRENNRNWFHIDSSADGQQVVAVAQSGQVYLSNNAGATWTPTNTNRNWRAASYSANGKHLTAVVTAGQIYTSVESPPPPLVFTPAAGSTGIPYTSFTFQVEDNGLAGSNLDPTPNTFSLNVTSQPLTEFQTWAVANGLSTDPAANGGQNLLNFSFGTPSDSTRLGPITVGGGLITERGYPALRAAVTNGSEFIALYGRRKNAGITSTVQFSADLSAWENSTAVPEKVADDGLIEAYSVTFPSSMSTGVKPRFFRVLLTTPP